MENSPSKPPVRLILTAWGEEYVGKVLSFALPAVLAPGNLPVLAQAFSCTVVFVTEERLFDLVRASKSWQRLEAFAAVKLIPIDDLVAYRGQYGISLTLALLRGLEDLGPQMTETYLLFLNADFVLADGSYQSLMAHMLAGERLIHAPSYCVNTHEVAPMLRVRANAHEGILAIPPREMARLILDHRHNTIRAKTVNQRLFRMHRFDQFYWQVDDRTLLGRQLPIALVCMKPERVVSELHTFWDYGVVSEFCPTTKPCVLSDSDQFLMLELREVGTFRELFRLGWASPQEIADDLSTFATSDQRQHGQVALVLHDRDLPETLGVAQAKLDYFVGDVFRRMSPVPINYLQHPFWVDHYAKFQRHREEYLRAQPPLSRGVAGQSSKLSDRGMVVLGRKLVGLLEHIHARLFGNVSHLKQAHPYYSLLQPAMDAVVGELVKPNQHVLLIAPEPGPLSKFVQLFVGQGHVISDGNGLIREDAASHYVAASYDLCVCEVNLVDLLKFRDLFQSIQPLMAPQGKIIVFHLSARDMNLWFHQTDIIEHATVSVGQSQLIFGGSIWTKWALAFYAYGEKLRSHFGIKGILAYVATVLLAVPFSLIGGWLSRRRPPDVMGKHCLSITMYYRLF